MRTKYLLVLVLFIVAFQTNFAQLSRKHYIPPITTGDNIGIQYIYISTPNTSNIGFTITPVGQPSNTVFTGVVSSTTPFAYEIIAQGNGNDSQLHQIDQQTSIVTNDKGFIIESEDLVYVSVRVRQGGNNQIHAGAIVSKGLSALGTQFRVGGFVPEGTPTGTRQSFVSVMATEDDTNVTFNIPAGTIITNFNSGAPITGPITQNLNEGETYVVTVGVNNNGNPNDLIGSLVSSDKPIVVNSGSAASSFGTIGNNNDYGIDQIVDASKVGTEYIFVRGEGENEIENILIIAHEDNTEVFVNGNATAEAQLNAGDWVVIEGNGVSNNGNGFNAAGNLYVETSKPSYAFQGIGWLNVNGNPSQANQGMFFVPPLSCENRGNVDNIAQINRMQPGTNNADNFNGGVTIVTNDGATIAVFEDGVPRAITGAEGPFNVDGNPGYVTYRLSGLTGNVSVESSEELYCAYFNYNGFATSGSFYSGFPSPPEINFDTNVASLGNCIPNVTLQSLNTDLFDSVEWFFDDGLGGWFISTGNSTGTFIPTQPGNYRLIGTLICSGATFESVIIPVSLCPDDLDNDLIIDNVDLDLDNDGILNCDESRGDVVLDFTDTNQPILNFLDS